MIAEYPDSSQHSLQVLDSARAEATRVSGDHHVCRMTVEHTRYSTIVGTSESLGLSLCVCVCVWCVGGCVWCGGELHDSYSIYI